MKAPVVDSDSDFGATSDPEPPKNKSTDDDEWLRITGQIPDNTSKPSAPESENTSK